MKTTFPQLDIESLDDEIIRLTQHDGSGENCIIDIHPYQLQFMLESVGLRTRTDPEQAAFVARLTKLTNSLQERVNCLAVMLASPSSVEAHSRAAGYAQSAADYANAVLDDITGVVLAD